MNSDLINSGAFYLTSSTPHLKKFQVCPKKETVCTGAWLSLHAMNSAHFLADFRILRSVSLLPFSCHIAGVCLSSWFSQYIQAIEMKDWVVILTNVITAHLPCSSSSATQDSMRLSLSLHPSPESVPSSSCSTYDHLSFFSPAYVKKSDWAFISDCFFSLSVL